MNFNRFALVVSVLVLAFLVSTSSGFADISAVQDQLRGLQLKLIGQKIKQIQDSILQVAKPKPDIPAVLQAREPTVEEMSARLQNEIAALESLVSSLKPRALDERVAAMENQIGAVSRQIQGATGPRLMELQNELASVLADYAALQQEVKSALDATLKAQQAESLRQQINVLQEKVLMLPHPAPPQQSQYPVLQDQIQKAQLKLIQAQAQAIQEKISQLKGQ